MAARRVIGMKLRGVPVLMYHGVAVSLPDAPDRRYWVTTATLRRHLSAMRGAGISPGLLRDHWGPARKATSDPAAIVTFDDGRTTDYEVALPVLAEANVRAEFFINTANVGKPGYATWSQLQEMQRAGMSIQSHGHEHIPLLGLSLQRLEEQLRSSKEQMEDRLGRSVDYLAAPYGLVGRQTIDTAFRLGFHAVCTSRPWPAAPGAQTIDRVVIEASTSDAQFAALLGRRPSAYLPSYSRMALKEFPKRVLLRVRPSALPHDLVSERA